MNAFFNSVFYQIKPMVPRRLQIAMRRKMAELKRKKAASYWPIMDMAARKPRPWSGWPKGKQFALILTHDVETETGQENCSALMELEKQLGLCSSFNFVPLRYHVSKSLLLKLKSQGFEVGIHGLYHDGKLFSSRKVFMQRVHKINAYLKEWNAVGFRAPAMHHNLDWLHELNVEYDMSTFDVDPFEPQSDGVNTIYPFVVSNPDGSKCYVEMPYTLPQDFTLQILLRENSYKIWKQKLEWIAENQGMVLLNTHPDYMTFKNRRGLPGESYCASIYGEFLSWIKEFYSGLYWNPLPKEMARYWRKHYSQISLPDTQAEICHNGIIRNRIENTWAPQP